MLCHRPTQTDTDRSLTEPAGAQSFLGKIAEGAIWPKPAYAARNCMN